MRGRLWLLAAVLLASPTAATADEQTHMSCPDILPVWEPGVGGISVSVNAAPGSNGDFWIGPCISLLSADGSTSQFLSVMVSVRDPDPGSTGVLLMAHFCQNPSGTCSPHIVPATGAETGDQSLSCGNGTIVGFCNTQSGVWVANPGEEPDLGFDNKTGVELAYHSDGWLYLDIYADSSAPSPSIPITDLV